MVLLKNSNKVIPIIFCFVECSDYISSKGLMYIETKVLVDINCTEKETSSMLLSHRLHPMVMAGFPYGRAGDRVRVLFTL